MKRGDTEKEDDALSVHITCSSLLGDGTKLLLMGAAAPMTSDQGNGDFSLNSPPAADTQRDADSV